MVRFIKNNRGNSRLGLVIDDLNLSRPKRSQVAIEFVILIGVILFFFVVFLGSILENNSFKAKERNDLIVKDVAFAVRDEINLAVKSVDGYLREFEIVEKISGLGYEINLTGGMVYVRTDNGKHAMSLPVSDVNGQPVKGLNVIRKKDGEVYLNL